jgi:hypothetical protein
LQEAQPIEVQLSARRRFCDDNSTWLHQPRHINLDWLIFDNITPDLTASQSEFDDAALGAFVVSAWQSLCQVQHRDGAQADAVVVANRCQPLACQQNKLVLRSRTVKWSPRPLGIS